MAYNRFSGSANRNAFLEDALDSQKAQMQAIISEDFMNQLRQEGYSVDEVAEFRDKLRNAGIWKRWKDTEVAKGETELKVTREMVELNEADAKEAINIIVAQKEELRRWEIKDEQELDQHVKLLREMIKKEPRLSALVLEDEAIARTVNKGLDSLRKDFASLGKRFQKLEDRLLQAAIAQVSPLSQKLQVIAEDFQRVMDSWDQDCAQIEQAKDREIGALRKELDEAKLKKSEKDDEVERLCFQVAQLETQLVENTEAATELQSRKDAEIEQSRNSITHLESKLEESTTAATELQSYKEHEIKKLRDSMSELEVELEESKAARTQLQSEKDGEFNRLTSKLTNASSDIEDLKRQLDESRVAATTVQTDNNAEIVRLQVELMSSSAEREDLHSELEKSKARVESLRSDKDAEMEKIRADLAISRKNVEKYSDELRSNRAKLVTLRSEKDTEIDGLRDKMKDAQADIDRLESKAESDRLAADQQELHNDTEIERLQSHLRISKDAIISMRSEKDKEIDRLQAELNRNKNETSQFKQDGQDLQTYFNDYKFRQDALTSDNDGLKAKNNELSDQLNEQQTKLARQDDLMTELQTKVEQGEETVLRLQSVVQSTEKERDNSRNVQNKTSKELEQSRRLRKEDTTKISALEVSIANSNKSYVVLHQRFESCIRLLQRATGISDVDAMNNVIEYQARLMTCSSMEAAVKGLPPMVFTQMPFSFIPVWHAMNFWADIYLGAAPLADSQALFNDDTIRSADYMYAVYPWLLDGLNLFIPILGKMAWPVDLISFHTDIVNSPCNVQAVYNKVEASLAAHLEAGSVFALILDQVKQSFGDVPITSWLGESTKDSSNHLDDSNTDIRNQYIVADTTPENILLIEQVDDIEVLSALSRENARFDLHGDVGLHLVLPDRRIMKKDYLGDACDHPWLMFRRGICRDD
ncbi:MAG: hypothetical protein Q9166_002529 [cf. Caloplaca sp. 2 TL-2023]